VPNDLLVTPQAVKSDKRVTQNAESNNDTPHSYTYYNINLPRMHIATVAVVLIQSSIRSI
jgi:hypothetical protein